MYTGPVGRLSTCPASSFLTTSPRGSAAGLGADSAVLPHAARTAAITAAAASTLSLEPLWAMMAIKVIRPASVRQWSTDPGPHGPEPACTRVLQCPAVSFRVLLYSISSALCFLLCPPVSFWFRECVTH